jgi:hypothetical protein
VYFDLTDDRIFFAELLIQEISHVHTLQDLRKALHTLPDSIELIYGQTLQRISSQAPEYSELGNQVLMWLAFSYRQMSRRELQHALAVMHIQPGENRLDEDWLPSTDTISDAGVGLVTVDEEGDAIRFSHVSAWAYLNRVKYERFPKAQLEITQTCLAYLSLEPFASGPCLETKIRDRTLEYPFALYAAEFWLRHAKRNEESHIGQIVEFLAGKKTYESWIQILKQIAEPASGVISPEDIQLTNVTQALSVKLAVCRTPFEAANALELYLVAATLAERGIVWQ